MKITKLTFKQRVLVILLGTAIGGLLPILEVIDGYTPFGFKTWYDATFGNWGMFVVSIQFCIGVSIKTILSAIMKVAFGQQYDRELDTFDPLARVNQHIKAIVKLYHKEAKGQLIPADQAKTLLRKVANDYVNKHKTFFGTIYTRPELKKINSFENVIAMIESKI